MNHHLNGRNRSPLLSLIDGSSRSRSVNSENKAEESLAKTA